MNSSDFTKRTRSTAFCELARTFGAKQQQMPASSDRQQTEPFKRFKIDPIWSCCRSWTLYIIYPKCVCPNHKRFARKFSKLGGLQPPSPPRPVRLCLPHPKWIADYMCITEMSRWPWVPLKSIRGSEWGHLDNTKHLIFWLKQLNFRHFRTNRKKFTVTVNFSQKETKTAPKRPILICLVYQEVFSHFPTIPDHFGRFPKTTEDFQGEIRKSSTPQASQNAVAYGTKKETTAPLSTGSKFMDSIFSGNSKH